MLINKNRYQISKDRKLMYKVGKQWVVVSAFVLALLGAKGAKTMIHASSTQTPDQQVTNQINQRLQQSQKLIEQRQNNPQSINQDVNDNPTHNLVQKSSNTQNITKAAIQLHNQILARNVAEQPQPHTQVDRSQNEPNPDLGNKGYSQSNLVSTRTNNHEKLSLGNTWDQGLVPWTQLPTDPTKDHTTIVKHGVYNQAKWALYQDGLLYIHDGVLGNHGHDLFSDLNLHPEGSDFVDSIVFKNCIAQPDMSHFLYNGGSIFSKRPIQYIYLPGLNVDWVTDMHNFMNVGEVEAYNLDFSNWNLTPQAAASLKNIIDGTAQEYGIKDPYLESIEVGPNSGAIANAFYEMYTLAYKRPSDKDLPDYPKIPKSIPHNADMQMAINPYVGYWENPQGQTFMIGDQSLAPGTYYNLYGCASNVTINYTYNGKIIAHSNGYMPHYVTSNNLRIPTNFELSPQFQHMFYVNDNQTVNIPMNVAPDTFHYNDIYNDVDYFTVPNDSKQMTRNLTKNINQRYTLTLQDIPKGWVLVNKNGQIISPHDETFTLNGTDHIINIAPIYDGLTFKYNHNAKSIEFINGKLSWNGNDSSNNHFIGQNLNTHGVKDSDVTSVKFGSDVDTTQTHNMSGMFNSPYLQTINLGNAFDTNNVSDMSDMFGSDTGLKALTLSKGFDTSKVTSMKNMFTNDNALDSVTVQSPKTKINDRNGATELPQLYQSYANSKYTSSTPNDFSKGNVGTFIRPKDVPVDTIDYVYKSKTLATQQFSGVYDNNFDITDVNAQLPEGYQLINKDTRVLMDNNTHQVSIEPKQNTDTINYAYKNTDRVIASTKITGNVSYAHGASDTSFMISNQNHPGLPVGYQLIKNSPTWQYNGSTHNIAITPIQVTDNIRFEVPINSVPSDYLNAGMLSSDDNDYHGNYYQAQGASDTNFTPSNTMKGLPKGYHVIPNQRINYNGISDTVHIEPNRIMGTATLHLHYQERDANGKYIRSDNKDVKVPINGLAGASDIVIKPVTYAKDNYNILSSDFHIPMNIDIAPSGDNLHYNVSDNFTYAGTQATADVTYVDVASGAQLDHNVKDTATGNSYSEDNNQTVDYQGHNYPVVGHQNLSDLGVVGQTVNLTAKGTNVGTNDMIAPKGFHFVSDNNNDRILFKKLILKPNMHLTVMLGANDKSNRNKMPRIILKNGYGNNTDNIQTGVYDGLSYKFDKTTGYLEFTGGTLKATGSDIGYAPDNTQYSFLQDFLNTPVFGGSDREFVFDNWDLIDHDYNNEVTSVKFDSDVNTTFPSNMDNMFRNDNALRSIDFGNSFDTSNVKEYSLTTDGPGGLYNLFGNKIAPSDVIFGKKFSGETNITSSPGDKLKIVIKSPKLTVNVTTYDTRYTNPSDASHTESWYQPDPNNNNYTYFTSTPLLSIKPAHKNILNHVGTFVNQPTENENGDNPNGIETGFLDGLYFKYNDKTKALEFISGTLHTTGKSILSDHNITPDWYWYQPPIEMGIPWWVPKPKPELEMDSPYSLVIENAKSIKFDSDVNASKTSDMSNLFSNMPNVQAIDFGNNFDTSHVKNMQGMFFNSKIRSLNLNLNTSHVNNMNFMFGDNNKLQSLNLGHNFTTNNVNNTSGMFYDDDAIQQIDIQSPLTKFNNDVRNNDPYSYNGNTYWDENNDEYKSAPIWFKISKYTPVPGELDTTKRRLEATQHPVNLSDNNSHVGDWMNMGNISSLNDVDTVIFERPSDNDAMVGSASTVTGAKHSNYVVKDSDSDIPQGYKLTDDGSQKFTMDNGNHVVHVSIEPNLSDENYDIPVIGNTEVVPVKFIDQNGHQVGNIDTNIKGTVNSDVDLPTTAPIGYILNPNQPTKYLISDGAINPKDQSQTNVVILHVTKRHEIVPIEFIDQNGNRVGNVDTSRQGTIGLDINLPMVAPNGYTLNSDQPTKYLISDSNIDRTNPKRTNLVIMYVTGKLSNINVQYELLNGTKVNNEVTISNQHVGDQINLTKQPVPNGYVRVPGQQNLNNYIVNPDNTSANPLIIYVAQDPQNLMIDYVDSIHNKLLDSRTVTVKNGSQIYLTNNDVNNDTGTNVNSFVDHNRNLVGYQIAPHQTLSEKAELLSNGTYPTYTVNMQAEPVTLKVNYFDPSTDGNVGSDVITKNIQGQVATVGDTIALPMQTNANQHGLNQGYTLDDNQPTSYQIQDADTSDNGHAIKSITLMATGDRIDDYAPVTIKMIDADGNYQGTSVVNVPVNGEVGDQITFNSSDFQGYLPNDYVIANDYRNHNYSAKLMPNATHQWQSNDWQNLTGKYWDSANQRPLLVIQSAAGKQITVDFINQAGNRVGSTVFTGDYNDSIDLQNPITDAKSVLKTKLPNGYTYGNNNPAKAEFGQQPETVNINVLGDQETIHGEYDDSVNDELAGSVDELVTGHRVGDTITLPTVHLPQGYRLANGDDLKYTINASDDPQDTGMITRPINVVADPEVVPVKFVDQNGHQIGCVLYQTKGVIGQNNVALPSAPSGYTYASSTNKQSNPTRYNFTADQMSSQAGLMKQHVAYLQADTEVVPVQFVDQSGQVVHNGRTRLNALMGTTVTLPNPPQGYKTNQSLSYTLMPDNLRTTGYMKAVDIPVTVNNAVNAMITYEDQNHSIVAQRSLVAPVGTPLNRIAADYTDYVPYDYNYAGDNWSPTTTVTNNGSYVIYVTKQKDRSQPVPYSDSNDGRINVNYQNTNGQLINTYTLNGSDGTAFKPSDYTKSRRQGGQMPNNFRYVKILSGNQITQFSKGTTHTLVVQVNVAQQPVTAFVEYEDAKTHQIINNLQTSKPLRIQITGRAGDNLDYGPYQQFVPQGYTYYGMGNHDDVLENGDIDIVMVRKAKPNDDQLGQFCVHYVDSDNKEIDTVNVAGINGWQFNLGYYENDLPYGYVFNGIDGTNGPILNFNANTQDVTIHVKKSQPIQHYGKITIHFVKADAEGVSSAVNGNQATSDQTLQNYEVPGSLDEVMTGRIGDLFSPEEYEHNTPQGTTFDHIVKGNDIDTITANDQNIWIAVQAINGQF